MSSTNTDFLQDTLKPYQPQLEIAQLVVEVNKLFHKFDAKDYDRQHPEIHQQLPPIWQEMICLAIDVAETSVWRILDFGCGTGFEAEQLIRNMPEGSIAELTCYDPSPEMLACCQTFYEGLGLVLIEAQAAGKHSIFSDVVPEEVDVFKPLMRRISLARSAFVWAEAVMATRETTSAIKQLETIDLIERSPFNIQTGIANLEKIYILGMS
jgi:SAM-dependent methyltransferase